MRTKLKIAYTPDPDDAFHYHALETGAIVPPPGVSLNFSHAHIQTLNESCLSETFDICAISSVHYPNIDEHYVILGSGASVGRGYGPVLGCHRNSHFSDLAGRRVAIPGPTTTGCFLLQYFYRDYEPVVLPFNEIAGAIARAEVDAGVLIHEELLNFTDGPVKKLCCLGARWFEHTDLPLPVGLNVARRSLGTALIAELESLIHESMRRALAAPAPAMAFASQFGRGPESSVRADFVDKFANTDTLLMPADVREGLKTLYTKALKRGFIDHMPRLDLVDPVAA